MRPKHWFHCSPRPLGASFVAERRPPILRAEGEPDTPRLCVCPTVAGCFAAVLFRIGEPVFVYRTFLPRRAVEPKGVWDKSITGERWLIPPVEMTLIERIDPDTVEKIIYPAHWYHHATKRNSGFYIRLAQYALAAKVLANRFDFKRDRTIVRLASEWGISDPEEYFFDAITKHGKNQ